jgi:predicted nuclease of predicted toxin-antitoxin system
VKLLLDEMIGPRVAEALREDGIDTVGVAERTDLRALPDDALLEHALQDVRIVVTRNISDFARLDQQWRAAGRTHAGLVMITESAFPQNRNLVGALVHALRHAHRQAERPAPGIAVYLRPADEHGP